jgi:DNA-binding transcriptional MerR regulator
MFIGELSKKTGFSRDTIRYYEKLGLIGNGERADYYNNYKNYSETVLKKLLAIRKIKEFGFTLKEMQGLFILFEEGVLQPERGVRYVKRKIAVIDNKISDLLRVKNRLEEITNASEPGQCPLDKILEEMIEA